MGGWDQTPDYGGGGRFANAVASIAASAFSAVVAFLYFAGSAAGQSEVGPVTNSEIVGAASVIDGDTLEIRGQRIRLSGLDSPESGRRCGQVNVHQRASLALADFIGSRTVRCRVNEHDRYGRAVAQCSVSGVDLGDHMVSHGWARDWPRYSGGRYADEESAARAARRGLWGMACPADLWGNRSYAR